ncbi:MAG: Asp-tRNA(Asn)/Glu-tRNA(Gln) amidotransferase GatCAB subunit B, partial [Sandaracinaceae bacterium]|nr:Asp-tRNA(Asn)/Glu-tRNA(Gln) amidotransferase GatCAB subunit B [Sandaracinaceae bacterium]
TQYDAQVMSIHPRVADFFEKSASLLWQKLGPEYPREKAGKRVANFVGSEVLRFVQSDGLQAEFPCTEEALSDLLALLERGQINGKIAKDVFAIMVQTGKMPQVIIEERGLVQVQDEALIERTLRDILAKHPKELASYRAGKKGVRGFFVGQAMRSIEGADPQLVNRLLDRLLESIEI